MMPIKLICASLNFQRLDAQALKELSNAYLNNNPETILNFKVELGFPVEQLAIIEKCNAVILVFCYYEDLSEDFIQGRILSAWDKLSQGGIIKTIKYIKFFDNIDAIKYLGECSLGLHSVTLGDSQVLSQVCDALGKASDIQSESPVFSLLTTWLKHIASEAKLRTKLFAGNTSIERLAAEITVREIKKAEDISLIGFGKSGQLIAKILNEEFHYDLIIANRSVDALLEIKKKMESILWICRIVKSY